MTPMRNGEAGRGQHAAEPAAEVKETVAQVAPPAAQPAFRERLSVRLTGVTLACGFVVGLVLSLNQIWLDYREERRALHDGMANALALLQDSAAEAVYNLDPLLARHVVQGLASRPGVSEVRLVAYPEAVLSSLERPPDESGWRAITDLFFGAQNVHQLELRGPRGGEVLGELHVAVDTYQAGRAFLDRALVILVTGVARAAILALVLLWVFTRWITRPLNQLVAHLSRINPAAPARVRLPLSPGHERDELGVWVQRTNALLEAVEEHQAQRSRAESDAAHVRQFDPLTDLPNRALFHDRGAHALQRARAQSGRIAVLVADLRHFHAFNERHGAAAGDLALRDCAGAIRAALPAPHTVARLAGDRFGMVVEGVERVEAVATLAQSLLGRVAGALPPGIAGPALELAVGIALHPDDGVQFEELLRSAEKALRHAKAARGGRYQFYDAEMDAQVRDRKQMERDLENALSGGELLLHYQPQFALAGGHLTGVEALLRWAHEDAGLVLPGRFVPLAEETGLIVPIGRWALRTACRTFVDWGAAAPGRLAVNVSAVQIQMPGFCDELHAILDETGLPPGRLELEVTESAAITEIARTEATLRDLRASGVHVALDDFGAGHSSLVQLRRLPATRLKIDQSFVRDVHRDEARAAIVRAIINLGHSLGHAITAEGVEQPEELDYLRANGCDEVQGFVCKPPMPAVQMRELLERKVQLQTRPPRDLAAVR